MNNINKQKLLNIKSHCELNKDLRIDELEKENAYLLIQLNKYKKQFTKLRPNETKKLKGVEKHDAIQALHKKVKAIKAAHEEEKIKLRKVTIKWRDKAYQHIEREQFVTKHFIINLGKEKFIEILGRLDNPDKGSRIRTKEKREKFLSSKKYAD